MAIIMNDNFPPNDYVGKILLNLIGGYFIFVILSSCLFFYLCWPFEQMAAVGAVYGTLAVIFIVSPVNTLILCLLYWTRINRVIIQHFRYILLEAVLYMILLILQEKQLLPIPADEYALFYPFAIIIPLAILHSLLQFVLTNRKNKL